MTSLILMWSNLIRWLLPNQIVVDFLFGSQRRCKMSVLFAAVGFLIMDQVNIGNKIITTDPRFKICPHQPLHNKVA